MDSHPSPSADSAARTPTSSSEKPTLTPEAIDLATRLFNAARAGELPIFEQALPAGLPINLTNDQGDTIVCQVTI